VLTSLQALQRLATLKWLGVFIFALATLLTVANTASALEPAQTKTRVWDFDFAEHNSAGLFRAASSGKHQGNRLAGAEEASGSLLAAEGATISARNIHPIEVAYGFGPLGRNQRAVLDALPEFGSETIVRKGTFNMRDLAALTAETGDEFAMFTTGGRRLIVRGGPRSVPITVERAGELSAQGFRWSGHTHPGPTPAVLPSSVGDRAVLEAFGHGRSQIRNSIGERRVFTIQGDDLSDWLPK
jgi:hypothetical protein